jgi:RNA polymerase sigma-70 factor (ECF subfamily)
MVSFESWWTLTRRTPVEVSVNNLTAQQVFHLYAGRVYHLARRLLGNDSDAEDITQDVLLQVVRKLGTFRGEANITTWLHRITVNAVLMHRRRQGQGHDRPAKVPLNKVIGKRFPPFTHRADAEAPDDTAERREIGQLIEQRIALLPAIYRVVLVLADLEGLSNSEIGEILELSVPAVKSRLHRARLRMRTALEPHFARKPGL